VAPRGRGRPRGSRGKPKTGVVPANDRSSSNPQGRNETEQQQQARVVNLVPPRAYGPLPGFRDLTHPLAEKKPSMDVDAVMDAAAENKIKRVRDAVIRYKTHMAWLEDEVFRPAKRPKQGGGGAAAHAEVKIEEGGASSTAARGDGDDDEDDDQIFVASSSSGNWLPFTGKTCKVSASPSLARFAR